MIELLLLILLCVIVLGAIFWVLTYFGVPQVAAFAVVAVIAIVLLLALVGESGDIEIGNGR